MEQFRNSKPRKCRPGFIHFGGDFFQLRLAQKTHFALDLGAVFEYSPSQRTVLRFDIGDTMIVFGGTDFLSPSMPGSVRLGTIHNLQVSLGVAVRF